MMQKEICLKVLNEELKNSIFTFTWRLAFEEKDYIKSEENNFRSFF